MAVSIAEIIVLSLIADWACRRAGIPGLIGMLAVGVLLGPYVLGYLDPDLLAIGAAPLMAMRAAGMDTASGDVILAVAVLSIVLTAPAGAWGIAAVGDRVLAVAPEQEHDAYDAAMESNPDEADL